MRSLSCMSAVFILAVSSLFAQSYPTYFSILTNSPVCDGQLFQINAAYSVPPSGTTVSFRWAGPNGFTSTAYGSLTIPASAATTGIYSVTMTFSGTNQGTATASTTVSLGTSKPMALVYDGPYRSSSRVICGPTSLSLVAYPDQTYSSNNASYSWTGPNGFASTERNPVVTQGGAGLYILEATYPGTCGVGKDTVQVYSATLLVNAASYSTGPDPQYTNSFCPGASAELRAVTNPPTGTTATYRWSGPNGFTSTAQSFTLTSVTPAMAGIYSVTATFSGACAGSVTASRQIQITNPSISLHSRSTDGATSNGSRYCPGTSINVYPVFFQASANFPSSRSTLTYQWSGPNSFSSSVQQPTIPMASTLASGLYSLTVTVAGECSGTYMDTYEINVGKPASNVFSFPLTGTAQDDTHCPGATINLAAFNRPSNAPVTSYHWSGPNGFTSSAPSLTLINASPAMSGVYSLTTVYAGQCAGSRVSFVNLTVGTPAIYIGVYQPDGSGGGNRRLCAGSSYRLSPNALTYDGDDLLTSNTYEWTLPDGTTSTSPSLTIASASLANAGHYILKTTFGGACASVSSRDTANIVVGIAPPQIWAGNRFIASGRSTTLYADKCNGLTVQWSDGQVGRSIIVSPVQTKTYTATCLRSDGCLSPPSAPLIVRVGDQPEADLSLQLSVSNRTPAVGQPVTVTLTIHNNSAQEARNVQVDSYLPSLLSVINSGSLQLNGAVLSATIASIPANSAANLSFQVAIAAAGEVRLSAQIRAADNPDPDSWPASGTNDGQDDTGWLDLRTTESGAVVSVSPEPNPAYLPAPSIDDNVFLPEDLVDLSLGLSLSEAVAKLNEIVTVTLLISNYEARRLLSPEVTCWLPPGLTFVGGTNLVATGQQVVLTGGRYYQHWPQRFSFQVRVTGLVTEPIKARISYCDWEDGDSDPTNGFDTGEDDTAQVSLRVR